MQLDVFETEPGHFVVSGPGYYQGHDPELPGFVPMSKERAEQVRDDMIRAITPDNPE